MAEKKEDFELKKEGSVRVRFAPSPTGFLHIGNARTALFNFLFAANNKGRFILRIEDTDKQRYKQEYEQDIYEAFEWLSLSLDEGPKAGGEFGPYRQSERGDIYQKYLEKLLEEDKAYYCFCSKQDLEAQRQYQMSIGEPPIYNGKCSKLSKDEAREKVKRGEEHIIRLRGSAKKIVFNDLVRGKVEFDAGTIGDFSLARSIKDPLYNFACVIDDHQMSISHVIRGEDHISNTPRQILIYEALGWSYPKFAHLPMILAPDKTKLSKRHGAVSVRDFKKQGYVPEAVVNFLAFLGWNPGTNREIFSLQGLIENFSLSRVKKSGAIFNRNRLDYLNGFYIRKKSKEKLAQECIPFLLDAGLLKQTDQGRFVCSDTEEEISINALQKAIGLYQERLKTLSEIPELISFFFTDEVKYDNQLLKWKDQTFPEVKDSIDKTLDTLSGIDESEWNKQRLEQCLLNQAESFGKSVRGIGDRGYLLWPFRVAITGKKSSAGPFEIAEILGREKVLNRLKRARDKIKDNDL